MEEFVHIASSSEKVSLERMEKFLRHHGIDCRLEQLLQAGEKWNLTVGQSHLGEAQKVLEEIALGHFDSTRAEEVVEINFDGTERTEVATWLQILLDEEDNEGSPIYYYKSLYESILDQLHETGQVEIPCFILRGLRNYIPEGPRRMLMGQGLQEFFNLIESVTQAEE